MDHVSRIRCTTVPAPNNTLAVHGSCTVFRHSVTACESTFVIIVDLRRSRIITSFNGRSGEIAGLERYSSLFTL